MVQNVGSSNNPNKSYGEISRVGTSPDGRVIYKVVDPSGKVAGGLSVSPNDCDKFERVYNNVMEAAPKFEKYMSTHTKEDLKKNQKRGRWITGIGAFIGGILPAVLIKKPDKKIIKILATLAGTTVGLFAGVSVAKKVVIPPGVEEMSKATHEMSKLDVRPI